MFETDTGSPPNGGEMLSPRWQTAWRRGATGLLLGVLLWITLNGVFNPNIPLLTPGPGTWIVYPLPPAMYAYEGIELVGTFRREFVLPEKPAVAQLTWRSFARSEVRVNGDLVMLPGAASPDWKKTSEINIGSLLRPGTNHMEFFVSNVGGPPALSMRVAAGTWSLVSDESWDVSILGSAWRTARAATTPPRPGKGNVLYPLEKTGEAWRRCWPWVLLFGAVSVIGVMAGRFFKSTKFSPKMILILLAAVWALLLLHNFSSQRAIVGFDAAAHLDYVNYIQTHHAVPGVQWGAETFHPPLYYALGATLLDWCHCDAFTVPGVMVLRFFSLMIGVVNLALIWAGLRLVFPGDERKPLAGVVLAAFLPAQLCLLHYPTNETLSAMWVTAALALTFYILRKDRPAWGWHGLLGLVLGLALLTKASAALAVPAILGALMLKLVLRRERCIRAWLGVVGTPLLICLLAGVWHGVRLARSYGDPFVDPSPGAWWQFKGLQVLAKQLIGFNVGGSSWQGPGLRTPAYYFTFGDALSRPLVSGFHSFWDALYTTL